MTRDAIKTNTTYHDKQYYIIIMINNLKNKRLTMININIHLSVFHNSTTKFNKYYLSKKKINKLREKKCTMYITIVKPYTYGYHINIFLFKF